MASGFYTFLIFDLDDTLMDTHGQLVGPALKEACQAMIDGGLRAELGPCLQFHTRAFRNDPRSNVFGAMVGHFGVHRGRDPKVVQARGERAFFCRDVESNIQCFDGATAMLAGLGRSHSLFLVTSGDPKTQQQKVSLLGLEPYFDALYYVNRKPDQTKLKTIRQLLEGHGLSPSQGLVIGDRLDREIRAANELGIHSCHVRHGEFYHLKPTGPEEIPTYQITHILQLKELLHNPEPFKSAQL